MIEALVVINETIRATHKFLIEHPEIVRVLASKQAKPSSQKRIENYAKDGKIGAKLISDFLGGSEAGWSEY